MTGWFSRQGIRNIHCLGIGGAGMSGLAEILNAHGYKVTGSDLKHTPTTNRLNQLGITIDFETHDRWVSQADLVVYSSAIPSHHPERQWAKSRKIPSLSRGEALGELMRGYQGIAVAGTHGKTSTVGIIAQLLQQNSFDPTIVIGGYLNHLKSHARFGEGRYFLTEADESDGSLLFLNPKISIMTHIDQDHLGHYENNFNHLIETYRKFIEQTQALVIFSEDDPISRNIINQGLKTEVISYGFEKSAMIQGTEFSQKNSEFSLTILRKSLKKSSLTIRVPLLGKHNAYNVLAAIAVATHLNIPDIIIQHSLEHYHGVARRLQYLGEVKLSQGTIKVFDDYGHHPREIEAAIKAIRDAYPGKRIVLIFQPHRYSRTKDLFEEFADVLARVADQLFLLPIYAAHEPWIKGVDHFALAKAIRQKKGCVVVVEPNVVNHTLPSWLQKDDIVLFQGAGSVGQIAKDFQTAWMNLEGSLQHQYL